MTKLTVRGTTNRFGPEHVEAWRRDGGVSIQDFFTPEEVAAVSADFEQVFGRTQGADEALSKKKKGEIGKFNPAQFATLEAVPFDCSPALNLIGAHPALIAFARQALACEDVHLYQCQAWAKFTGDADYDQPFHCDYSNHTLTAPSEDAHLNSVTILCYFSDVTEAHGPAHYVTRPDSAKVGGPEVSLSADPKVQARLQRDLSRYERSTAAPAGSAFPYCIDVYHRGTNITAPRAHRYAVMACYKRAGDESIAFHAWAFHHRKPWRRIFEHATPEQLACFGVQPPGDPFWTDVTLQRAQTRYPGWDLAPYRAAMAGASA
ncbi:MAG: phytanoyl-CoA dioxygenase family protein [Caulobacterales bacterium]